MFCGNITCASAREIERWRTPENPRRQARGRAAAALGGRSARSERPTQVAGGRRPASRRCSLRGTLGRADPRSEGFLARTCGRVARSLVKRAPQEKPPPRAGLGFGVVGLVTVAVAASVFLLVSSSLGGGTSASVLLQDAALLWVINLVTFAVWYWEIDGGGPAQRSRDGHTSDDFLFPQMNIEDKTARDWSLGFLDYLFLAFNTSTAFSPTDTAFLSQRTKVLMMVQALLSLLVLAVLVSRAINTLAAA